MIDFFGIASNPPTTSSLEGQSYLSFVPPYVNRDWQIKGFPTPTEGDNENAGIRYLWSIYFRDFVSVAEETWDKSFELSPGFSQTNQEFWTKIFKSDLQGFVDNLPNLLPQDLQNCPNSIGGNCNNLPSHTILGPHVPGAVVTAAAPLTDLTFTYKDWFLTSGSNSWFRLQPKDLRDRWDFHLVETEAKQRSTSPYIWLFGKLLQFLEELQTSLEHQGSRISAITTGQNSAVDAQSQRIKEFKKPTSASDFASQTANKSVAKDLKVYQGDSSFLGARSTQQNSAVQRSSQALEDEGTLIASLITQMESILNNLFK
jgi:hypothetical protein